MTAMFLHVRSIRIRLFQDRSRTAIKLLQFLQEFMECDYVHNLMIMR